MRRFVFDLTREDSPALESTYIPPSVQDNIVGTIADLIHLSHRNAVDKGFYSGRLADRSVGELLALVHSEISEALEDWRNSDGSQEDLQTIKIDEGGKPEGFAIELADAVIRILDLCGRYKINLGRAIVRKMIYNRTRERLHGGKIA